MNHHVFLAAAFIASGALVAHSRPAEAQSGSAEAEELFKQGRASLEAKDYATACARFSASLALERAVGTLISLAQCEEATAHLASARQHWQEAADLADATNDRLNRGPFARKKMNELDPRVPRLVIRLAPGAPKDTTLQRDDVALGGGAFDVSFPIDPGAHIVVATETGHEPRRYPVSVSEGDKLVVEVEPGPAIAAAPTPTATRAGETPSSTAALTEPPSSSSGGWRRGVAYGAGVVGIVGIGLGTYFGVTTLSKWSTAKKDCGTGCGEMDPARNEKSDANSDATLADVSFVVGGVALATAIVLLVTAPSSPPSPGAQGKLKVFPSWQPGGGGLVATGSF
jgi:hypothetical protein